MVLLVMCVEKQTIYQITVMTLLNKIRKTMKQTNRKEDKERSEQLIKQIREDVERMKGSLFTKREGRANKLAAYISNLERKTQESNVEISNKIQSVEEIKCKRMSEARVNQAAIVTELVEYKQSVENSLCFGIN